MEKKLFRRVWDLFLDIFSEEGEDEYDPVHIGGMIIFVMFFIAVFYWDLWALLVYQGGLFSKILPFLKVLLTGRTLKDFGYEFFWDAGIFSGWLTNLIALFFFLFLSFLIFRLFRITEGKTLPIEEEK